MDTLLGPYFHFCLELAWENWVKADTFSVGSWPWPHPLISERSMCPPIRANFFFGPIFDLYSEHRPFSACATGRWELWLWRLDIDWGTQQILGSLHQDQSLVKGAWRRPTLAISVNEQRRWQLLYISWLLVWPEFWLSQLFSRTTDKSGCEVRLDQDNCCSAQLSMWT